MKTDYRTAVADRLRANCPRGYEGITYPLAYSVKLYGGLHYPSSEKIELFEWAIKQDIINVDVDAKRRLLPALEWDAHQESEYAVDDARHGVTDSDTYRTLSPLVEGRYGLESGEFYDAEYEFVGRSGGYIAPVMLEGIKLTNLEPDDFRLLDGEDSEVWSGRSMTQDWCKLLLAFMDEWQICFTQDRANTEVSYLMASSLEMRLDDLALERRIPVTP